MPNKLALQAPNIMLTVNVDSNNNKNRLAAHAKVIFANPTVNVCLYTMLVKYMFNEAFYGASEQGIQQTVVDNKSVTKFRHTGSIFE